MDRQGADFYRVFKQVKEQLSGMHTTRANAHAIQLPIGAESDFIGVIDLIERKGYLYEEDDPLGKKIKEIPVPADMQESVEKYRKELEEAIVETDDALMNKYLEGQEISPCRTESSFAQSCLPQ